MKAKQRRQKRPHQRTRKSTRYWVGALILGVAAALGIAAWKITDSRGGRSPERFGTVRPEGVVAKSQPASAPEAHEREFVTKVNQGNELLSQGKTEEAITVLTEALRLKPDDEDVHYDLALALARQGRVADAIQHYEEALRLFPDYLEARNNLGNLLTRVGRAEEAILHLKRALEIMPDYSTAENSLGTAFRRLGRTNEALAHFQQAVRINPEYWEAHFNVATSFLEQGNFDDARRAFETVLRLKPDFAPARMAIAELEKQEPARAGTN